MSVRANAIAAVERHRGAGASPVLREVPDAGTPKITSTAGDVAAQLARYLPSEVVAAYTTVVGVLPNPGGDPVCSGEFTARWLALIVFAILTPATLQSVYLVKRRAAGNVGPAVPRFEHIAALTAFLAWSLALPLTPIGSWCDWQPQYGAAVAAVVLLVLGLASQLRRTAR